MNKRLPAIFLTTFLFMLGLQWVLVTPAHASMNRVSNITSYHASKSISQVNPGIFSVIRSLMTQSNLIGKPGEVVANKQITSSLDSAYLGMVIPGGDGTVLGKIDKGLLQENFDSFLSALRMPVSKSSFLDSKSPHKVSIDLAGTGQVNLSEPIILTGFLRDISTDVGIPNKTIRFLTNGTFIGQTHTDDNGTFRIQIKKALNAGNYLVIASFKGAHLLAPASNTISFEVLPATVRVETVPAIAGIAFQMDGRQFVSGQDGSASIKINEAGTYRLDVLLDQYHNPSQQVEFGRWSEESYQPFRNVVVPANGAIQVGLNVYHRISLKFIDLDNAPVDSARITSISIRSAQGDVFTLKSGDTPWLPSIRTARRQIGLEQTDLLYSVNSVTLDGSNVVNSAQQRFYAQTDDTWTISLLLYSLHVTTRDGLFAAPVGTSINVGFPNGQVKNYPLDKSGGLEIHGLARGIYHITLIGIKGLGTSTPVALSRNQVVSLNIVTPLDLAVAGSVSIGFGVGLIFYGRPWLLRYLLRRKRKPSRKVRWDSLHEN